MLHVLAQVVEYMMITASLMHPLRASIVTIEDACTTALRSVDYSATQNKRLCAQYKVLQRSLTFV
jgi:hypothetical protein